MLRECRNLNQRRKRLVPVGPKIKNHVRGPHREGFGCSGLKLNGME